MKLMDPIQKIGFNQAICFQLLKCLIYVWIFFCRKKIYLDSYLFSGQPNK